MISNDYEFKKWWKSKPKQKDTVLDLLNNPKFDRGDKLIEIDKTFVQGFPEIEGDKVTFIGSTFMHLGDKDPYLNHCIALNSCDDVAGAEIDRMVRKGRRCIISMERYYPGGRSRYYYWVQYKWL